MRLLLLQQNEVVKLEDELNAIDKLEQPDFFLGSMRQDQIADRKAVLERLDVALEDYGMSRTAYSVSYR
jgi:uncharacterized protein YPO0396